MAETTAEDLLNKALEPKRAADEAGSVEMNAIDPLEAYRLKKAEAAASAPGFGIRIARFKPPSALGE